MVVLDFGTVVAMVTKIAINLKKNAMIFVSNQEEQTDANCLKYQVHVRAII